MWEKKPIEIEFISTFNNYIREMGGFQIFNRGLGLIENRCITMRISLLFFVIAKSPKSLVSNYTFRNWVCHSINLVYPSSIYNPYKDLNVGL